MEQIIVRTKQGTVSGKMEGRFAAFKGIPYGKAARFRRAEMCRWDGVLDCTGFGKKAPQVCPVCAHPQSFFEVKASNY